MRTQPFPEPNYWNDGEIYYDTVLEAQLQASIEEEHQKQKARQPHAEAATPSHTEPPAKLAAQYSQTHGIAIMPSGGETELSRLMSGCGIAAVDGYLTIRDYAQSKGLDLIELHHKGINFQDILSTLIIHTQRMAEMDGGRRFRR